MAEPKPKAEKLNFVGAYRKGRTIKSVTRRDPDGQIDLHGKTRMQTCTLEASVEGWYCFEEELMMVRCSTTVRGPFTDVRLLVANDQTFVYENLDFTRAADNFPVRAKEWFDAVEAALPDFDSPVKETVEATAGVLLNLAEDADKAAESVAGFAQAAEGLPNEDNDSASGPDDETPDLAEVAMAGGQ